MLKSLFQYPDTVYKTRRILPFWRLRDCRLARRPRFMKRETEVQKLLYTN